jgi:hypothetical protein
MRKTNKQDKQQRLMIDKYLHFDEESIICLNINHFY